MTGPIDILIVEDDPLVAVPLRRFLESKGWATRIAYNLDEARAMLPRDPLTVLLDLRLPDGSGAALVPEILAACPDAEVIVCTGEPNFPQIPGVSFVYIKGESDFDGMIGRLRPPRSIPEPSAN